MSTDEKAFWTHEMSKLLSVSDSTLRKWCIELEKQGYVFTKGQKNSRAFLVRDTHILLHLKYLVQSGGLSVETAVNQVLLGVSVSEVNGSNDTRSSVPEVVRDSFEGEFEAINERFEKQEQFNQKLLERLDERDRNLMAVLKEVQETRKEIASDKEKKKWWEFWKE